MPDTPAKPAMPKIIGAGFGRTGTMSLKIALEQLLGRPCYHMITVMTERPDDIERWREAARGEAMDWQAMFADFAAMVDWPVARFYAEMLAAFPDAKFVLTVRDPARWYESANASIYRISQVMQRFPATLLRWFMGKRRGMAEMAHEVIWGHHFAGQFADRELAMHVFEKHISDVKRHIPPAQLLVFDVKQGWGPLCEFLGVEVPEGPFPHSNETAEFSRRIRTIQVISWGLVVVLVALAAALVFALVSLLP